MTPKERAAVRAIVRCTGIELLPLPEPCGIWPNRALYSAEEFLKYARANVIADRHARQEPNLTAQIIEALEVGHDYAQEVANDYHIGMAGYRQALHDVMHDDVAKIAAAIKAFKRAGQEANAQHPMQPAVIQKMTP